MVWWIVTFIVIYMEKTKKVRKGIHKFGKVCYYYCMHSPVWRLFVVFFSHIGYFFIQIYDELFTKKDK